MAAIRPDNRYMPNSRLLWVEQTSNLGGGSILAARADRRGHGRRAASRVCARTSTARAS